MEDEGEATASCGIGERTLPAGYEKLEIVGTVEVEEHESMVRCNTGWGGKSSSRRGGR